MRAAGAGPGKGESWRSPLRRARLAIEATLRRIEAGCQIIDATERFAASGRNFEAFRRLEQVPTWVSQALAQLGRAHAALYATTDCLVSRPDRGAPAFITETVRQFAEATVRLSALQGRYEALFDSFVESAMTDPSAWHLSPEGSQAVAPPAPKRAPIPTRRTPRCVQRRNPIRNSGAAAARRICRGRAPPIVSTSPLSPRGHERKRGKKNEYDDKSPVAGHRAGHPHQ